MVTGRTALYVEMWPDSGRFICYPAAHPVDGELAERDTDFSVQLAAAFWTAAWNCISSEAKNSSALYEQLTLRALTTLASAYDGCQPSVVTLYAFEYEGTEGVTVITNDVTNDDSRKD